MQLTRNNDDPKLLGDLERLAGASSSSSVPPAAPNSATDEPSPLDDAFVRRFVQVVTHVRRYAPFYAGGALWLLVMILIQPVGRGGAGTEATTSADYASSNTAMVPPPNEGDRNVEAPLTVVDGFGLSVFPPEPPPEAESATSRPSPAVDPAPPVESDFPTVSDPVSATPTPLRIVASGYASQGAGSPYDPFAPKTGGLPVAAAGDRHLRRSFIRLAGTETILRLRMTTDQQETTMNADTATIKACAITTPNWTPVRGQTLDSAPAYSTDCATGIYQGNNVWTFDLSGFPPVESGNGFALVPPSGASTPFQVTFESQAVAA